MTTVDRPPVAESGGESPAPDAARANGNADYNLAARVYDSPVTARNGHSPAPPLDPRYNLAARVYGERATTTITTLEPPPSLVPQPAVAPGDGGRRREPPRGGRFNFRILSTVREVPAFRWYTAAAFGSFMVMNMQMLVRGFLVYDMTGSFALLGGVALANAIPGLALTMVGGVVADRARKKYVVQIGQALSAIQALVIGLLLLFGALRIEHLFISSAIQGVIFAIMMPARQAWLPEVVGIDRLMNAIPLNTAVMTGTRLIGPSIGGVMLALVGPEYIYFTMAGLYVWSVALLARVPARSRQLAGDGRTNAMGAPAGPSSRATSPTRARRGTGGFRDIGAGVTYIARHPVLRMVLLVNLVTVMLAMPYMMMLPGWVIDVLGESAAEIGFLQSIGAIGALIGALLVASLPNRGRGKYYLLGSLFMGLVLIGYSQTATFWIAAGLMILVNFGSTLRQSVSQVLVQSYVDDEYRGRVMSVYMMQMSVMQFGSFAVGVFAEVAGAQTALLYISLALVAFSGSLLLFVPGLRRLD